MKKAEAECCDVLYVHEETVQQVRKKMPEENMLGELADFYKVFGDITDGISVERTIEYWPKYGHMKVGVDDSVSLLGGKSKEVQVCPYVFYEMCVNSDGTYSLCRFDWNHKMIMDPHVGGRPTPKKIWNSITLWQFQCQFLRKERKHLFTAA